MEEDTKETVEEKSEKLERVGDMTEVVFSFTTSENVSIRVVKNEPNWDEVLPIADIRKSTHEEDAEWDSQNQVVDSFTTSENVNIRVVKTEPNWNEVLPIAENRKNTQKKDAQLDDNDGSADSNDNGLATDKDNGEEKEGTPYSEIAQSSKIKKCVSADTERIYSSLSQGSKESDSSIGIQGKCKDAASGINSLFLEEVQHVQGFDGEGNKVVILRLPKQEANQIWRNGKIARIGNPVKTETVLENLTKVSSLNCGSSAMKQMVKSLKSAANRKRKRVQLKKKEADLDTNSEKLSAVIKVEKEDNPESHVKRENLMLKSTNIWRIKHASSIYTHSVKFAEKQPRGHQNVQVTARIIKNVDQTMDSTRTEPKKRKMNNFSGAKTRPKPACNILRCLFCGKKFAQIVRFKHHMKTHLERKPLVCIKCDEDFYFYPSLIEHYEESHSRTIAYHCSICEKYFWEDDLSQHLLQHEPKHHFKCGLCLEWCTSNTELFQHVKQEHESKVPVKCGICLHIHVNFENLESHLRNHFKEGKYVCKRCCKVFRTVVEFSEHSKIHTGEWPFECGLCKIKFQSRVKMKYHENHCMKREDYPCRLCDKMFMDRQELKVHCESVHQTYNCNFCYGIWFDLKEDLANHMKTHKVVAKFI